MVLAIGQKLVLHKTAPINLDRAILRLLLFVLAALGCYYLIQPVNTYLALAVSIVVLLIFGYLVGVLSQAEKSALGNMIRKQFDRFYNARR